MTTDAAAPSDLLHALAALRDSNARHRVLADTMLHGVVHQRADGRIIAMNPAAERILGKTLAEMLGNTSEDLEHHTIREDGSLFPGVEHPVMIALATGEPVRKVVMGVYNPREQQRRWIRIDAIPLREGDNPTPVEAYTVFEDITEQRATADALARSEAHFRSLVEHMPDLHLRANVITKRYEYVSPSCSSMLGFSPDALMQMELGYLAAIVHDEDRPFVAAALKRVQSDGRAEVEFRATTATKQLRWFWAIMTLVPNAMGIPQYWDTLIRDITDRKHAELLLHEADEQKNRFIATLAHELRNPLAPLANVVDLLQDPIAPARLTWCRDLINRQVTQMSRLLDDLLDLSRLTHGKIILQRDIVTLTDVLERGLEMARPTIDARGHRLVVDVPDTPLHVVGDIVRLAQVCCNLLTNAAKYTNPGGQITLRVRPDGTHGVMEVEDNGIGIPEAELTRIFGMFSQIDHATRAADEGLGIGLALVKGLVALHDGAVTAHSQGPGHGSCFQVRLPLVGYPLKG
jgi:PAS domain S-box-containing protein